MEALLEFARGPLFRFSFAIMILGLLRVFVLDIWGAIEAFRRAGDKVVDWSTAVKKTIQWLIPVKKAPKNRPIYSIFSIGFHIGLIILPLFLFAHVQLWKAGLGISWITLDKNWADILTLTTIGFAIALFIGRIAFRTSRAISRKQDYIWPMLLIIPFITGYICANLTINPATYQFSMLLHILSGELIFVMLPFTKIAHCIIMPLSQFIIAIAWKFPADTDEPIVVTLNKKGEPV